MLIISGIIIIFVIFVAYIKRKTLYRLHSAIYYQNMDYFFEEVDKPVTRTLVSTIQRESLRLNAFIIQEDTENVTKQINKLMKEVTDQRTKRCILIKGYLYYAKHNVYNRCKRIMVEMEKILDEGEYIKYKKHFEITMGNSQYYIESLEKDFKREKSKRKGAIAYLLFCSYNTANSSKSKYFEVEAKELLGDDYGKTEKIICYL